MPGRRSPLPAQGGPPDGELSEHDETGKLVKRRLFGPDGRAVKDIDYGHDHGGHGDPHAHDWDWSRTPPRQPARGLQPGERE